VVRYNGDLMRPGSTRIPALFKGSLWAALVLCLAHGVCPCANAVEGDLYFLGVALNQQTLPGGWARLGAPGSWRATLAGTVLGEQIYTVERNGGLFATVAATGQWRPIGKLEFANTAFLFAAGSTLYTVENDGSLYSVDPHDASWQRIGEASAWRQTRAGAVLDGRLYTVESNGRLFVTDLATGQWEPIGEVEFAGTVFLFAQGSSLLSIESDGSLYRIAPGDGQCDRVGPAGAWRGARAGAMLEGKLYTAESGGGLFVTNPSDGRRIQIGKPDFAATAFMFAAAGQLNTIESDGSLYRVSVVAPPTDPYAWCVEEIESVFRDQGKAFYHAMKSHTVIGGQATSVKVAQRLAQLGQAATVDDLVVVYIGCHGITDPSLGWGFCAADGEMFWGSRMKAELGKLPCQVLMLIETCTSGGFALAHRDDPPVPPNLTAICACSANQVASNELDLAVGEALYGRADSNRDGAVDLDELIAYVPRRYKEWWPDPRNFDRQGRETPVIVKAKAWKRHLPLTESAKNLAAIAHQGSIWSALLEQEVGGRYRIHPLGWSSRPGEPYFLTNEVARDFICLPGDGAPLLVEQQGTWYPARLLGRYGPSYRVHYLGWNEDEIVTANRIRYPFVGSPAP
jgi:hypothetical protein